jgi:hypothetical protein
MNGRVEDPPNPLGKGGPENMELVLEVDWVVGRVFRGF